MVSALNDPYAKNPKLDLRLGLGLGLGLGLEVEPRVRGCCYSRPGVAAAAAADPGADYTRSASFLLLKTIVRFCITVRCTGKSHDVKTVNTVHLWRVTVCDTCFTEHNDLAWRQPCVVSDQIDVFM